MPVLGYTFCLIHYGVTWRKVAIFYQVLRGHHRCWRAYCRCNPTRGVDPYGTGGTCPPIFMKGGDIHSNVSPNILEVMSFRMSTRVTATVVCCILAQILCVVSQKTFSFWGTLDPLPGLRPWTLLFFCVPPIILRDRRRWILQSVSESWCDKRRWSRPISQIWPRNWLS